MQAFTLLPIKDKIDSFTNLFTIISNVTTGINQNSTQTDETYINFSDYIWENHSNLFSVFRRFNQVRNYEKVYGYSSKELVNKWKNRELTYRNEEINEWLTTYLQIKNFINE